MKIELFVDWFGIVSDSFECVSKCSFVFERVVAKYVIIRNEPKKHYFSSLMLKNTKRCHEISTNKSNVGLL